jgi:hypothetical protein
MSSGLTRRLHELEEEYARERAILFPIRMVWIEEDTGARKNQIGTVPPARDEM